MPRLTVDGRRRTRSTAGDVPRRAPPARHRHPDRCATIPGWRPRARAASASCPSTARRGRSPRARRRSRDGMVVDTHTPSSRRCGAPCSRCSPRRIPPARRSAIPTSRSTRCCATRASDAQRGTCRTRRSSTTRTRRSASTCRAASPAGGACASATRCRASSSGSIERSEAPRRGSCPDSGTTLADSSCVSCGACVDTCPSGALEDRSVVEPGTADAVDPHDVPVLRRRLRAAGRDARRVASCRSRPRSTRRSTAVTCASRVATASASSTPPIGSPRR